MNWEQAKLIIERFEQMAATNLRELKQLHRCINESKRINDRESIMSDKRNATRKIDQLQEWLKQVLELRSKLKWGDLDKFDSKIEPLRMQITSTIRALNELCSAEVQTEERNIYSELYEAQSSFSMQETDSSQKQLEAEAMRLRIEQAREDAEETKRLASNIEDLNEIMLELGQLVHAQHEVVDSIEEHVERTRQHVEEGHKHLKKAVASQNAKVPLVAAAVGGVALGGPVGFAAGSAVAGICTALGGAIAGFYSGLFLKKKAQDAANRSA